MNALTPLVLRRLGREALIYAPFLAVIWLEQMLRDGSSILDLFIPLLMASLLLRPSPPMRVLERFALRLETEWRLAKGIWSRRDLARAFVAETVGSSLLRAAMYTAVARAAWTELERGTFFPTGLGSPQLFGAVFLFTLGAQSAWFVIANAPASHRAPNTWRRGDLLRTQVGEWATNSRLLLAIGLAIGVFGVSTWTTGSPWGLVVPGFGFLALLAWILPEVETPSGGSGAAPRRGTRSTSTAASHFGPIAGLLWEGSHRSTKLLVASSLLLTLVFVLPETMTGFAKAPEVRGISWLMNSVLLVVVMWRPFRWQSAGDGARFLWMAGVDLRRMRRTELLFGLGASLLAIVAVLAYASHDILGLLVVSLFWPICPMVLLCNRAALALPGLKRVRVRDRTTTFLWCLVPTFFAGSILLSFLPESWSDYFSGGLLAGLFGVFVLGGLAAWMWAFLRAGDDAALRRFEFDRLSRVR